MLGSSAGDLTLQERLPLIWFLVLFPPSVFVGFSWLVRNHHGKLYGPSDYQSDEAFLQTLPASVQAERLTQEVNELIPTEVAIRQAGNDEKTRSTKSGAEGEPAKPAPQIVRPEPLVVRRSHWMREVALAEDLLLRKLSAEYGVSIRRQSAIGSSEARAQLDGFAELKPNEWLGIEVKLVREETVLKNLQNRLVEVFLTQSAFQRIAPAGVKTRFLLAFLDVDLSEDSRKLVRQRAEALLSELAGTFEIRFIKLDDLKKSFGISEDANGT